MINKTWVEGQPLEIVESLNLLATELRLAQAKNVELEKRVAQLESQQPTELQKLRRRNVTER